MRIRLGLGLELGLGLGLELDSGFRARAGAGVHRVPPFTDVHLTVLRLLPLRPLCRRKLDPTFDSQLLTHLLVEAQAWLGLSGSLELGLG